MSPPLSLSMSLPLPLSRRQLLAGTAGAVSLGMLPPSATRGAPASPRLKIGVATLGFPKLTHAQLAPELAGAGIKLIQLVARHTPAAPLILEYVGPADYRAALAHLRAALAQAGLPAE